jgi:hypothetical protein
MQKVFFLALLFACTTALAQTKTRLVIKDQTDGVLTNQVDYTIVPPETLDEVLQRFGYDETSLSQMRAKGNRNITISTEELLDSYNKQGQSITETVGKRSRSITIPKGRDVRVEDLVKIPPGAKVEDMPDGSKRITTYKTDSKGNRTVEKTVTVRRQSNPAESDWEAIPYQETAPVPSSSTLLIPADAPRHVRTEVYRQDDLSMPDVSVRYEPVDEYDQSTLSKKDLTLERATWLKLENLSFKPDFQAGKFVLAFQQNLPKEGELKITCYDILGTKQFEETVVGFSGKYEQSIASFSAYQKGVFLLLITQNGQKFTQKITID